MLAQTSAGSRTQWFRVDERGAMSTSPRRRISRLVAGEPDELVLQPAGVVCGGQKGDPSTGGGKQDSVAGSACTDAEPDGQVGLAGAGRPEQDHVLLRG